MVAPRLEHVGGLATVVLVVLAGCGGTARVTPVAGADSGAASRSAVASVTQTGPGIVRTCASRVDGAGTPGGSGGSIGARGIRFTDLRAAALLRASDLAPTRRRYLAYKTVTEVDASRKVIVTIAAGSRRYARLLYDPSHFRDDGRYLLTDGQTSVTFVACARDQPTTTGSGTVGAKTQFNGGFIVAGRRCVSMLITSSGDPRPAHVVAQFGVAHCG